MAKKSGKQIAGEHERQGVAPLQERPHDKSVLKEPSGANQLPDSGVHPDADDAPATIKLRVWRGEGDKGEFVEYEVPREEGMVVLDAVHRTQSLHAQDLAVRWNCKAGKCGSCSAEVNGMPRLMCMTRLDAYDPTETITIAPVKTFPRVKDLVSDVSWNYRVNKQIKPFAPAALTPEEAAKGELKMMQRDVDRVQEFRKCIECFLCQNVCHVLRDGEAHGRFFGPRFFIRTASLEMHPRDAGDRVPQMKNEGGVGLCNITKCCTEVCPEHIRITDNGIIPLKERVADRYYDPLTIVVRKVTGADKKTAADHTTHV